MIQTFTSSGRCVALAEEWHRLTTKQLSDPDIDEVTRLTEIEREITAESALTVADILAKAQIAAAWEQHGLSAYPDGPKIATSLLADLLRFHQST